MAELFTRDKEKKRSPMVYLKCAEQLRIYQGRGEMNYSRIASEFSGKVAQRFDTLFAHTLNNVALQPAPWCLFLIASSIILHTRQYLFNRSLWFDEAMNTANIVGKSYHQLLDTLEYGQPLPVGFLLIEKLMIDTFYNNEYVLRLFPFLCGIFSVILFYLLIKKYFNSSSIILSVFFFSITDSLIYYSSEVKPYSSDVFISLLILLAVLYYDSRKSRLALIVCAVTGAFGVWVSYSSVFVLSGLGITLFIYYLYGRNFNKAIQFIYICGIWSLSFFLLYHLSAKNQISAQLVNYWSDSFAPFPPLNTPDFIWYFQAFLNIFTDPLSFQYKYLAGALYLLGCVAVFGRSKIIFFLFASPVVMTLIASGFQKYPFYQRTLIFLIPFFCYLISEGILWVYKRSVIVCIVLTSLLAFHPLYNAGKYFIIPRTHEDIKPLLLEVKKSWKEGDKLYIDSWVSEVQFQYYKDRFGFKENDYKVIPFKSFYYRLPEEKSFWLFTSHSPIDSINQISRYLKMFGEETSNNISPNTYKKVNADSAVLHYNIQYHPQEKEDRQFFLPGIGEWQGFYHDSWTNGDTLIKGLKYPLHGSYGFLILALNDYNPLKPDFEEMGLAVFINNESIPFSQRSGNKYIFRLPSSLQQINTIRVKSKTFVPKAHNINEDDRELGVNIDYIMLSNAEYFFYPWEMHNDIIPGIPINIPVRFCWSRLKSSMSLKDFFYNNSGRELFLKCANPDIAEKPVKVTLFVDDDVIKKFVFDNNEWHSVSLKTINFENKKTLTLQVSRTWSPKAFGLSDDDRELGVALALPSDD